MSRADPTGHGRRRLVAVVALSTIVALCAGCSSDDDASEQALAEQLVAATQAAGVAPRLTVDLAESLYGTDAPAVCDAFDGEPSTGEATSCSATRRRVGARRSPTKPSPTAASWSRRTAPRSATTSTSGRRRHRFRSRATMTQFRRRPTPPTVRSRRHRAIAMIAWPALAMLMVASVGSIAQLSDSASFGLGAVTVYLIPALLFLLPVGLVSAELATSHRGGIFVWVRDAFGDRTGFQATWFVFMNSVTLYPSLLSFGAAALATAFGRPDLASNGAYMGTVVLVVFWLATWIVSRGMKSQPGISNIGLTLGTIIPALFLIFFMFAWLVDGKPSQIAFDRRERPRSSRHRAVEHRPRRRHLRRLRRPRGERSAHRAPEGPAEELPQGGDAGGRHRLHDVPARIARHLGRRARRHPRAHLRRVAGLHRLRRRLRRAGALEHPVGAPRRSARSRRRSRGSADRAAACGSSGGPATCRRRYRRRTENDVQMPLLLLQGGDRDRAVVRLRRRPQHVVGLRHCCRTCRSSSTC